jgi:hypothetical protein
MISSSKPPSGIRKALALPVLLAVMALACSKEQSAPAKDPMTQPLSVDNVRLTKITRDSVQVAIGSTIKRIFVRYLKASNVGDEAHVTIDTLGVKARLDLGPGFRMDLKEKPSYLPPPANDEVILGAPEIKQDSHH